MLGLWWIGALHFIGPEALAMMRSPEFGPFAAVDWPAFRAAVYLPILAYSAGLIGVGVVTFAQPNAHRAQAAARLVLACVGMWILLAVWLDSPLAPIVAIGGVDDIILRVRALLHGHDPHLVADFAALIFAVSALIGVQAILAALWGVIAGEPEPWGGTPS